MRTIFDNQDTFHSSWVVYIDEALQHKYSKPSQFRKDIIFNKERGERALKSMWAQQEA